MKNTKLDFIYHRYQNRLLLKPSYFLFLFKI